jgi:MoaA/NifB/PqqE/SkfB family radical SAM enzyme
MFNENPLTVTTVTFLSQNKTCLQPNRINVICKKNATLNEADFTDYNTSRHLVNRPYLCHAPFNNMYFNVHGQVAPCWLTLQNSENIRNKSISEIWHGEWFTKIRNSIRSKSLDDTCSTCAENIRMGNYISVLAKLYDLPHELTEYPSEMEFELSNICNLECVMCKGDLSSAIREKREKLPPIETPYGDSFVEQLKEFLPYLKEVKFLGGEPFLIPVYYKIWDAIIEVNPNIKITVTTNGTVWNNRVQRILESLHCNIIMSIDSFSKDTYQRIRIGASYQRVIENFERFREYCTSNKTYMGISINPLRKNWEELGAYTDFCNTKNVPLWFNTVVYPYAEAIWTLSPDKLSEIYSRLSSTKILSKPEGCEEYIYENNLRNYSNLVDVQIKNWYSNAVRAKERKQLNLPNLAPEDLTKELLQNLTVDVMSDAYIPKVAKEKRAIMLRDIFEKIKGKYSMKQLQELYTMPPTEALSYIEQNTPSQPA